MSENRTRAFAVDSAASGSMRLDAISQDDGFDWSSASVVSIDHPPHEQAFDTDQFYKIPLVAARPVEQTYNTIDGERVMKKPAQELRQTAWSLDNAPITLGHPPSRIVDSVDKIHGFVREPEWDSRDESLKAHAYIPTTDTRARAFIEANDGVSIGFWYEADEATSSVVDAYQRDLLVDHVAIVAEGRCSREDGCGLGVDSDADARILRGFAADLGDEGCSAGPCSCGIHTDAESFEQHKYDSRARAMEAAERMGCDDVHQHEDGTFMPCESHQEFEERLEEQALDAAEYSQGDWVRWNYSGGSAVGRVERSSTSETLEVEGGTREASEDNPAYRIEHWDGGEFGNKVVKRESELRSAEPPEDFESDGFTSLAVDEPSASMDELDEVYADWSDATNMSASELRRWSENPCSREASQNPGDVIRRNLRLLETNKEDWDTDDIRDAKRTISFVERMNSDENRPESPADGAHGCPTDWAISLLNWAHNPFDSLPDHPDDLDPVDEITVDGVATDRPTEDRHWTDQAKVSFDHQIDSRGIDINMATAPAPFYLVAHDEGADHTRQNVEVGGQLGRVGPYDAFEDVSDVRLEFDQPIQEPRRVYVLIYHTTPDGNTGDPFESQQGFVFDSSVVIPDDGDQDVPPMARMLRDSHLDWDVAQVHDRLFDGDGSYDPSSETMFNIDESRTVAGVTFQGVRGGQLDEAEIPTDEFESHYLYPADTKSESSYPVVDAEGYLRAGNVEAAYSLGARGGVDEDDLHSKLESLNEVFEDTDGHSPPIDPENFETDTTMTNDNGGTSVLDVSDLTVDAVAAEHEGVADLRDEVSELRAKVDALEDERDELAETVEEYEADEREALIDEITSLTSAWDEDELADLDLDELQSRKTVAQDAAADATVSGGPGETTEVETDSGDGTTGFETNRRGVIDLSETA